MNAPAGRGERLGSSDLPLAEQYDAALCDLDGVLYLADQPVLHAADSVAKARAAGMRFAYVTNNASRPPAVVAAQLTELGIPAAPDEVVTSAQAAARTLAQHLEPGAAVLVIGTEALAEEVRLVGMRPVRTCDEAGEAGPAAVVQGLSQTTSWADLTEAALALHRGALWIAGNTDATLPTPRGPVPGNGAFVAGLKLVTGKEPLVAGKPDPALHRASVERVGASRPLVIGDRLDTDVLGAVRGGSDSLLVLTGVAGVDELLRAPAGSRPTYVSRDLRSLLEPHPAVEVEGKRARCRTATATYEDGVVQIQGGAAEASDDALRAAAALAWSCADDGRPLSRA